MRNTILVNIGLAAVMLVAACSATNEAGSSSSGASEQDAGTKPGPSDPDSSTSPPGPDGPGPEGSSAPRAVTTARTTELPKCSSYVDPAGGGEGTAASPFKTIASAVAAAKDGEIICIAEGTYAGEKLTPGVKYFTLAGGFQTGQEFKVRDSAKYVSKVKGAGSGSFYRATGASVPKENQPVVFDGLEISNYAQAIARAASFLGQVDITNNFIHDNDCKSGSAIGGGAFLANVKGTIKGNVFRKNVCGRGGAVALDDSINKNDVTFANNLVDGNSGMQPTLAHGGGVYLFGNKLTITANVFVDNEVVSWGGGLFVGAYNGGGNFTTATLSWNVFRNNKAGIRGGGFFCDDASTCIGSHDTFDGNCGGNLYVDSGSDGDNPTKGSFSFMTNVNAKAVGCNEPGPGFVLDHGNDANDSYEITNSIFWGNAKDKDFATACENCTDIKVLVSYTMAQTKYANGGVDVTFGEGMVAPADPLFVDATKLDFHLKSEKGHWTPMGYVNDATSSPALGKASGAAEGSPAKAGSKPELGTFGNSVEASYTQ